MRDVKTTQSHPSVEPLVPDKRVPSQKHCGSMKRMAMMSLLTGTIMLAPLLTSAHPVNNQDYEHPPSRGAGVDSYIIDTGIRVTHNEFAGRAAFAPNEGPLLSAGMNVLGYGTYFYSLIGQPPDLPDGVILY